MLLYRALKFLLRVAVAVFFKEVWVSGRERLPRTGPLIVAVNHPNTLMDPVVVALQLKQRTGFLAKGSLFANPIIKWIFRKLHLIPVYRQQDVKAGEVANNLDSFRKCYQYLQKGGTLMIFPEGSSVNEMKLRKLKTGTARIALETAAQQNFKSGLLISPVSLNYSDPTSFRGRLSVLVEEPIAVDDYQELFEKKPQEAVQQLTDRLRLSLQKNIITAENTEDALLLKRIKKLYHDHLVYSHGTKVSRQDEFALLMQIAAGLHFFREEHGPSYERISQKVNTYFNKLQEWGIKEGFVARSWKTGQRMLLFFINAILLLLVLPLYLLGLITNYLPYHLPARIAKALGTDIEYRAGIMMMSGLFLFPLYYSLVLILLYNFVELNVWQMLIAGLSLPVLGFITLFYWSLAMQTKSLLLFMNFNITKSGLIKDLIYMREDIVAELEIAAKQVQEKSTNPSPENHPL